MNENTDDLQSQMELAQIESLYIRALRLIIHDTGLAKKTIVHDAEGMTVSFEVRIPKGVTNG